MPKIKIEKILSVSSEDKVHVAENILNTDSKKTWKCKTPGEQSCTIILQLAEISKISAIDIGNEHSAFVEVFVGRTGFNDSDYKMFLMMSSFMTPLESRQSENINRIRMFKIDDFCEDVRDERWDRIKFICTQPFNRHVQYGLSFVTLHSPENEQSGGSGLTESVSKLGKFLIRPESAVVDDISRGSFFNKIKTSDTNSESKQISAAAAIRKASLPTSLAKVGSPSINNHTIKEPKPKTVQSPQNPQTSARNYKYILYDSDDEKPNEKVDKAIEKHKTQNGVQTLDNSKPKNHVDTKLSDSPRKNVKRTTSTEPSTSREQPKKKLRTLKTKPFNQLMEDVVFTMSGYQNPQRADLRNMALKMGAKYRPDWGFGCTHLVCAFKNTPKYNEVRGLGKIVTCDWITECHSQRKRLPWRRFALDSKEKNQSESEEEIVDENSVLLDPEELNDSKVIEKRYNISSDSDTEDEIERVRATLNKKENGEINKNEIESFAQIVQDNTPSQELSEGTQEIEKNDSNSEDIYNKDTDVEDDIPIESLEDVKLEKLPKLFSNFKFFIYENLPESTVTRLKRYIFAYGGLVIENITEAQYILMENESSANLDPDVSKDAQLVHPAWIWECHDAESLLPVDKFLICK